MASGERTATASAADSGMDKAIVTCVVEGLQVAMFGGKVKNGTVSVKFDEQGFDLTAVVKEKNGETTFRKTVKKLPGRVDIDQCKWKAEKGKVVITLVKAKQESWAVQLSQKGLEQHSDDEDN